MYTTLYPLSRASRKAVLFSSDVMNVAMVIYLRRHTILCARSHGHALRDNGGWWWREVERC
jgi:hypothetical protein